MSKKRRKEESVLPAVARCAAGVVFLLAALLFVSSQAIAASPQDELDSAKSKLERAEEREGVLTTTLSQYSSEITAFEGQVAALRSREAVAREELSAKEAELDRATAELNFGKEELASARAHLERALVVLRERLVAMYESGSPDIISVLLSSDGYSELAARSEYLARIREQDESIAGRVRQLRDEAKTTVQRLRVAAETVKAARDEIATREQQLVQARASAEARQAELIAVRAERQSALERVKSERDEFGAKVASIQQQIAAEINQASSSIPLPAGPVAPGANASGLIWPVEGVITSGFGPRWGSFHPGLDIGAAEGTPIYAAASGTVVLMQSEAESGGYGNFTCIDHGGGLSTCYAHQTSFATSLGASVSQGVLIGYVGNTGFSTGPHLHFEVRVNGEPQDPLGYL
jgi:murein DD-endopeptidase MepM/ murein hydrolase activator NlpD